MRRVLRVLGHVASAAALLCVLAVLALAVVVPKIAGATPYTILTGSMEPDLPPGTLVVIRPIEADEVEVGSVITYQLSSGEAAVATHRVIAVGHSAKGGRVWTTQGDANEAPDPRPVEPVQLKGELWYSVPLLGHVNTWLTGKERQMTIYIVAGLLLGYAGFMVASALRDRGTARVAP